MQLDLLSPRQAAAALNLTVQNVGRLAREGQLTPAATIDGRRLYTRQEVQRCANERHARAAAGEFVRIPAIPAT